MTDIARTPAVGPVAVLGAALLWGTVGPAQVLADSGADPGSPGVARLLVCGAALAAFCPRTAPLAGTLSFAEPLLAAVLGVVVLEERLAATALAGGTLMIAGLVAVTVWDQPATANRPNPATRTATRA